MTSRRWPDERTQQLARLLAIRAERAFFGRHPCASAKLPAEVRARLVADIGAAIGRAVATMRHREGIAR